MQTVNWTYSNKHKFVFEPLKRYPLSWKEEIYNTATTIGNSAKGKLYVCMSGGIDGEIVARSLIEQNIPFNALTLKYKNGLNDHDIIYALDFCREMGIKHDIVELDLINFLENDLYGYIQRGYLATNIHRYIELRLIDEVENRGGCAILGGGDQIYFSHTNQVCLAKAEDDNTPVKYIKDLKSLHYNEFFSQNSEIFASWLNEPIIQIMTADPDYYRNDIKISVEKILICHKHWPTMKHRRKYSGFENIVDLRLSIQAKLENQWPHLKTFYMPVSKIKKNLYSKLV